MAQTTMAHAAMAYAAMAYAAMAYMPLWSIPNWRKSSMAQVQYGAFQHAAVLPLFEYETQTEHKKTDSDFFIV